MNTFLGFYPLQPIEQPQYRNWYQEKEYLANAKEINELINRVKAIDLKIKELEDYQSWMDSCYPKELDFEDSQTWRLS